MFQLILVFMLDLNEVENQKAGLSKSYPVGQRELIKNGPDSSEIIGKHIDGRPGKDNKVGSSEISAGEGRKFIQYRAEPGEITRGYTRETPIENIEENVDTEQCKNEMYGINCTMPCPVNCEGNCKRSNGFCFGCKGRGQYGNRCEMTCEQCINLACYFFDGTCIEGLNATYVNMNSTTDTPMKDIDDKVKVKSSDISSVERRTFAQNRPKLGEITRGETRERETDDIEVGQFDVNALTSGEVTRKGILREQANRNSKDIQDIQDDNDPLNQWNFNMNVKIFNRTYTYLFGNFSSNPFPILLMSVMIIVAIVGMYVICEHSPGAI